MGVNGRDLGRFSFWPKSPQKGRGHLKHDFRLTERLLPDSTMTYRGRSDGLVVESDRKKIITFKFTCHLRDLEGYCVHTQGVFFSFFFPFPLGSASPQSSLWTSRPCSGILIRNSSSTERRELPSGAGLIKPTAPRHVWTALFFRQKQTAHV